MELKNVVKFFIFLIVIVFDPLAVALIIAFNGLILPKKRTREELLSKMAEDNQKWGLYEVYGDKPEENQVIEKDIFNENQQNEINEKKENESIRIAIDLDGDGTIDGYDTNGDGMIDEWNADGHREREIGIRNSLPYYAKPDFDWSDRSKWINDQNAINYWLKYKKSQEEDLIKTY